MKRNRKHIDTRLGHLGLNPFDNYGIPNPPVYRTSTILSSSLPSIAAKRRSPIPMAGQAPQLQQRLKKRLPISMRQKPVFLHHLALAALTTALAFAKAGEVICYFQIRCTGQRAGL